jgi:hypothetical protein
MTTAVFGDFLDHGSQHLQAAARRPLTAVDLAPASPQLLRLLTALTRYLEDRSPVFAAGVIATADLHPWERAAIDASTALRRAAGSLTHGIDVAGISDQQPGGELARSLQAAAMSLTAGRDLLQTHLTTSRGDLLEHRSEWAPVLTSLPVSRALTQTVVSWCEPLAAIAVGLASAGRTAAPGLADLRTGLLGAAHWLQIAAAAIPPAPAADPASGHDVRLLRAIPAAHNPPRRPPLTGESVLELCLGATASAQRLRTAVFSATERAQWTAPTADAWRWTAAVAAVTGHASDLILQSLATTASHADALHLDRTQLQHAAGTMTGSWTAWRQVAASWAGLATEKRGQTAPAVTDLSDLVLRIGRLAWDDPHWTPARGHTAARRSWADPADSTHLGDIVAAIHQASDAPRPGRSRRPGSGHRDRQRRTAVCAHPLAAPGVRRPPPLRHRTRRPDHLTAQRLPRRRTNQRTSSQ